MTGGFRLRRFWTDVSVVEAPDGWAVRLDGRVVRTPDKAELVAPTRALADAVAEEWARQGEEMDPARMHLTRAVNVAIDRLVHAHGAVSDMLVGYGETDLLCHRAEAPEALVARQAEAWDPWLVWARDTLDAPLTTTVGIMPTAQAGQSLIRLRDAVVAHDRFEIAALHDLVALTGSLVLGLAVSQRALTAQAAWPLSRIDETWQAEQWGEDEEATEAAEEKRAALFRAERLLDLLRSA